MLPEVRQGIYIMCVRECVHACVCACLPACVRACVRACVHACVCVGRRGLQGLLSMLSSLSLFAWFCFPQAVRVTLSTSWKYIIYCFLSKSLLIWCNRCGAVSMLTSLLPRRTLHSSSLTTWFNMYFEGTNHITSTGKTFNIKLCWFNQMTKSLDVHDALFQQYNIPVRPSHSVNKPFLVPVIRCIQFKHSIFEGCAQKSSGQTQDTGSFPCARRTL